MSLRTLPLTAIGLGLIAALPTMARADNTACAGAIFIVPDGSPHEGRFGAPFEDRWFRFQAKPDRSYALMAENLGSTDLSPAVGMFAPLAGSCAGAAVPNTSIGSAEPVSLVSGNTIGSARRALKSTSDTDLFFRVDSAGNPAGPGPFRLRVEETTIVSPLFSTGTGLETFYRFVNTTNQVVSVTLKLVTDAGVTVANVTFNVAANATAARNTGPTSLNVADNLSGQAIITHDGAPGAIQADGFLGNFSVNPPVILPAKLVLARQQR